MMPVRAALACALLVGLLNPAADAADALPSAVEIIASKRTFTPETITLKLGRPAALIVRNEDEDLHAFVPLLLFQRTNVQVSGNGAPEFNEAGFVRVLIPPRGKAELRFIPRTSGTFVYICDLPGHNMRAVIIVE
ncbi:MAG: cupredoxin domain-containing protein [Nitrospirota bacterium]